MSERSLSTLSGVAFGATLAMLYLVSSCARGERATNESADSVVAATTTEAPVADSVEPPVEDSVVVEPVAVDLPPDGRPDLLSEWHQLEVRDNQLVTLDGVTPYVLNSSLFTDYAQKLRTVWLPDEDAAVTYDAEDTFDFPVGSVITKTFYYPVPEGAVAGDPEVLQLDSEANGVAEPLDLDAVRLIETRVLVHREDGWHAFPYVWNDDETEATLERTGDLVQLAAFREDGTETALNYVVPDQNQCASCHAVNHTSGAIEPIGPKARHLNREVDFGDGLESQLQRWQDDGVLTMAPAAAEIPKAADWHDETAPLEDRARAYLDINCAHCHNPSGAADTSGLFLDIQTAPGFELGVCKAPIAAGGGSGGRLVDIDPGEPDESILVFRMESTDPAFMMPELGRSDSHDEGVELISEWIESLDGDC